MVSLTCTWLLYFRKERKFSFRRCVFVGFETIPPIDTVWCGVSVRYIFQQSIIESLIVRLYVSIGLSLMEFILITHFVT